MAGEIPARLNPILDSIVLQANTSATVTQQHRQFEFAGQVLKADLIASNAVTANGTNFDTIGLFNNTASQFFASRDTSAVSLTAGARAALTLNTTQTLKRFAANDVSAFRVVYSGTGATLNANTIIAYSMMQSGFDDNT